MPHLLCSFYSDQPNRAFSPPPTPRPFVTLLFLHLHGTFYATFSRTLHDLHPTFSHTGFTLSLCTFFFALYRCRGSGVQTAVACVSMLHSGSSPGPAGGSLKLSGSRPPRRLDPTRVVPSRAGSHDSRQASQNPRSSPPQTRDNLNDSAVYC